MTPTKQQFTDAIANFQRLADLIDRPPSVTDRH